MRIRVGAQRLGEGRYRLYVTQMFDLVYEETVYGAEEFLKAFREAEEHTYGEFDADVEEHIQAIERLCPRLAGELCQLLDIEEDDAEEPVLKRDSVTLLRRPGREAFQLVRSDRGAWRFRIMKRGETVFVSKRIWSAAGLGDVWYKQSRQYLLPRLHEVAERLRRRFPELAEAAFRLDHEWDEAPKVQCANGLYVRPDWKDFVATRIPKPPSERDGEKLN